MSLVLGVLVGIAAAVVLVIAWRRFRAPTATRTPEAEAMQFALHAATSTLPHLRGGGEHAQTGSQRKNQCRELLSNLLMVP